MLLLIPALIVPTLSAQAGTASASMTVAGTAVPGGQISVVGQNLPRRSWIQLRWDGAQTGMIAVRTTTQSGFATNVTIPANATAGTHILSATLQTSRYWWSYGSFRTWSETPLASVVVSVTNAAATATPRPTATPVVTPRPTATPTPTPAATATPRPTVTPTATPVATPSPTPVPTATPVPTPSPTPVPTATPVPTPSPTPVPTATPVPTTTPVPTAPTSGLRVTSIPALLNALADNSVTDIVVANGTYRVSPASSQASNSLWIGSRFTSRTRAVTVRAETSGGVTFDGGGTSTFGGLTFVQGAHDQTWDGFVFANGIPTATGVVVFGGYAGLAAPHHITLRNITITRTVLSLGSGANDHGIYFSQAVGGPHDILIDGLTVDGAGGIDSALHFYHSDAANRNAWNVTVRRMQVSGTPQAVILWDSTIRDIVIEDSTITGAGTAVRYEDGGTVTLRRVTSTGSTDAGFYSSLGSSPSGVTFIGSSFR